MIRKIFFYLLIFMLAFAGAAIAREHTIGAAPGQNQLTQPFTTQEETDRDFEEANPSPPKTDAERIDLAFPQTDMARVIFEAFFELRNRQIALEGGTAITRIQLRDWFKAKLP